MTTVTFIGGPLANQQMTFHGIPPFDYKAATPMEKNKWSSFIRTPANDESLYTLYRSEQFVMDGKVHWIMLHDTCDKKDIAPILRTIHHKADADPS